MRPPSRFPPSHEPPRWRAAQSADDAAVVEMCLAYYSEDPGVLVVDARQVLRTLTTFRESPSRGRAWVLEVRGDVVGYALVVPFWSNELGGEVAELDEIYVQRDFRSRGLGTLLIESIASGELGYENVVALALGVTTSNASARRLYERLGFAKSSDTLIRIRPGRASQEPGA